MRFSRFRKAFLILPAVVLVPHTAPEAQSRASVQSIRADSTLKDRRNRYRAAHLMDGTRRSWCEGVKGDGMGQTFTIKFRRPVRVKSLFIKNGFGHISYWLANNRVREMTIAGQKITLRDIRGWQEAILPEAIRARSLTFRIKSVYRSVKFQDTCLEEISFQRRKSASTSKYTEFSGYWEERDDSSRILLRRDGKCIARLTHEIVGPDPAYCLWEPAGDRIVLHINPPRSRSPGVGSTRKIVLMIDPEEQCLYPKQVNRCVYRATIGSGSLLELPWACDFSMGLDPKSHYEGEANQFLNLGPSLVRARPDYGAPVVARIPCGGTNFQFTGRKDRANKTGKIGVWYKVKLDGKDGPTGWVDGHAISYAWRERRLINRFSMAGYRVEVLGLRSDPNKCVNSTTVEWAECIWLVRDAHNQVVSILYDFGANLRKIDPTTIYSSLPFDSTIMEEETRGVLHRIHDFHANKTMTMLIAGHKGSQAPVPTWTACLMTKCYTLVRHKGRLDLHHQQPGATIQILPSLFVDGVVSTKEKLHYSIKSPAGKLEFLSPRSREMELVFKVGGARFKIDPRANRIVKVR